MCSVIFVLVLILVQKLHLAGFVHFLFPLCFCATATKIFADPFLTVLEVGVPEVGVLEVGVLEIGVLEIGAPEVGGLCRYLQHWIHTSTNLKLFFFQSCEVKKEGLKNSKTCPV